MTKSAITNEQIRTRIEALRITSTAKCDADAFEELLTLRQTVKVTHVRVLMSDPCDCEESCDCEPELYVCINNTRGYGQAIWTYRDGSNPRLAYWCEFMGFAPFWAEDQMDAVERLREKLAWLGNKVEVSGW
ncbi:hypothetical protein ND67_004230 [Salmonella enterica subsp. enterica serovar Cotham]|nr:hypothetical protein [Salmonella enterica]EDW0187364.1 hypothetical protein [Salmonella enterica subsp. enterica serovar Cotham]